VKSYCNNQQPPHVALSSGNALALGSDPKLNIHSAVFIISFFKKLTAE
jgi:hypothetical protein